MLDIRSRDETELDCLAFGEVMLRMDPGNDPVSHAKSFNVSEGGGEYNVVQGLSNCFRQRTGIVTAFADNDIGRLTTSLIRRSGVSDRWIKWLPFDGVGNQARNGLYFMDRGFGQRGAKAVMDRGHTAISQLKPGDINWTELFAQAKPRWFHVGGVIAALGELSPEMVLEAMVEAKKSGAIVSFDLNYRASLWQDRGGKEAASKKTEGLIRQADVVFGVEKLPRAVDSLDSAVFSEALFDMKARFPNLKMLITTMRIVKDASHNDWGGMCLIDDKVHEARPCLNLPIYDRVGGGDAFAAGFIHGMLSEQNIEQALELAVSHGALVMSTPGDNSMVSLADVKAFASSGSASANR